MINLTSIIEARSADDTLYHITKFESAYNILKSNVFQLTPSILDAHERRFQKGKRTYYLSTSRSKLGGYTVYKSDGVVFNLDGNKLSHNYKIAPVSFWGSDYVAQDSKFDEAEDRIFSYDQTIPDAQSYIKSMHVMLDEGLLLYTKELRVFRGLALLAKQNNIPLFWYDNQSNFLSQVNPIDIDISKLKNDTAPVWKQEKPLKPLEYNLLSSVAELINKPVNQPLSDEALSLMYTFSMNPTDNSRSKRNRISTSDDIESDYYANHQSTHAHTIARYIRSNHLTNIDQLMFHLWEKWNKYLTT